MPTAYHLHIELLHLKPTIYRDVLVDPSMTLHKLHQVIQAAMGWEDDHLYGFAQPMAREDYYRVPKDRRFGRPHDMDYGDSVNDDAKYKVSDLLRSPKDKLLYLYDFGDEWKHRITLTAVSEVDSPLPHLVKAANGCPPEDSGGPFGAAQWADIWYDKAHPEHQMALEIYGEQEPNWLDFPRLQRAVDRLKPKIKSKITE